VTPWPGRPPRPTGSLGLRGEIRLTDLDPAVVPVTSNVAQVFPFQALLPADETGLRVDSKAQAEQVRSVSIDRLGPVIGRVPAHLMAGLDDALRLHLQL
jgi:mRNA interferase MazF